ncbi:MAG: hypothetical protein JO112_13740 [Planctomycetes bacterium]|nr:hypothetical protein [Planctomycetota bacterium]
MSSPSDPDNIPEALPVPERPRRRPECPHCGSTDLVKGLKIGKTAEVGSIGPEFRGPLIFTGTEPLFLDLCRECGTVTRLYVREPDRNWLQS